MASGYPRAVLRSEGAAPLFSSPTPRAGHLVRFWLSLSVRKTRALRDGRPQATRREALWSSDQIDPTEDVPRVPLVYLKSWRAAQSAAQLGLFLGTQAV